jgi:hypothetical protein
MNHQEIKFLLNYPESNPKHLNSLQYNFIASLKVQYNKTRFLTRKQVECLYEIREYLLSPVMEEAEYESDKYPAQYSSIDYLTTINR